MMEKRRAQEGPERWICARAELDGYDFEKLVNGKSVTLRPCIGVTIELFLLDIGLDRMQQAIDEARDDGR